MHKRKKLIFTLSLLLSVHTSLAQFDATLELSSLDGLNGFTLNGVATGDRSGQSVSNAGDVNGDGIDDLIIGSLSSPGGNTQAGSSHVVFGSNQSLPHPFDLSTINGTNGFVLNGVEAGDLAGYSVSAAGDVNGDGIDDLIIGAPGTNPDGIIPVGSSYVVFGSDQGLTHPFDLSTLNGTNGFAINGETEGDQFGYSVSAAGDVNGDGIDDLIIGAPTAYPIPGGYAGGSYLIFGSNQGLPHPFDLSTLNGQNGTLLVEGQSIFDQSGHSVSAAGDVNGDGIDDLIIGAPIQGEIDGVSGSFLVLGRSQFPPPPVFYFINFPNVTRINSETSGDGAGHSVSHAGDVNGDGIDDLIIGTNTDALGNTLAGNSYVLFGTDQGWPLELDLSSLDGSNGFALNGVTTGDVLGFSVSAAGDVNGDGIDDLIMGANKSDPGGNNEAGSSYVVFGSDQGLPHPFDLSTLNGSNGFTLNGVAANDQSGFSVSGAGDANGDGMDDLIIGAIGSDPGGNNVAGSSYVVFGREKPIFKDGFE